MGNNNENIVPDFEAIEKAIHTSAPKREPMKYREETTDIIKLDQYNTEEKVTQNDTDITIDNSEKKEINDHVKINCTINTNENKNKRSYQLSDEEIDSINKQFDDMVQTSEELRLIRDLPSNNGVEEHIATEDGVTKTAMVQLDPNTGEQRLLDTSEVPDINGKEEFDKFVDDDDLEVTGESDVMDTPVEEEEIKKIIEQSKGDSNSIINDICKDISNEDILVLLKLINRKQNNEKFSTYKELPDHTKKIIDKLMFASAPNGAVGPVFSTEMKTMRNTLADLLLDEFITNISMDRIKSDLNNEIENIFRDTSNELADDIVGYTKERNEAYRKYAEEKIEDEDKKKQVLDTLDSIEEASNLTGLKEFAKKTKIKKIELDKPDRVFSNIMDKYNKTNTNIQSIEFVRPILYRNINGSSEEEFTDDDINALFILFCKYCMNYSPTNTKEHAFMYYFMYNIALLDINKGKSKDVSEYFLQNIKEVIYNSRKRNNWSEFTPFNK